MQVATPGPGSTLAALCRCQSPHPLPQAFLWDSYQRVQQQLLKHQPLADCPMVPSAHSGHRPLSRAQSSPATATLSLPAQDTASKPLSMPMQEQPTKPHFTTGVAPSNQGLGMRAGREVAMPRGQCQPQQCLGVLGMGGRGAEQARTGICSLPEVALPIRACPQGPLTAVLLQLAGFTALLKQQGQSWLQAA